MASRKRSVTFSVDIKLWERALVLRDKAGITWSDVVTEAITRVVEACELVLTHSDNSDEAYNQVSHLARTNYLDSVALISEHQVKPEVKASSVKVSARTKVKK